MMLSMLFEETTYAEKKKIRESQSSGTTGTSGGEWETPAWLGNDHEVFAFEDEEFWEA